MSIHETTIICHLCKNPNPIHRETCLNCGEPIAVAPPDTNIGTTIKEKYKIERRLGAGGMGTVYLAKQFPMKRSCVLKLLNKEVMSDPANAKRFEREAIMCSKIWHPNAVQIYDYDYAEDGSPFIAMEYIKGIPFGRIIKTDYPFSTERIVHIFTQLCDVLEAGHVRGIVHRDLKPDNVMLMDLPTEEDFVKLLDFGLAKIAEPGDEAQEITQAGWALGTPKYMSPEQCRGTQVGPPTDIYALGVLLYYTCAGVLPFQADTIAALMMKQATEKPVSPSRRSQGGVIHPKLEKMILWALEKDVDDRLPSALEFKRQLLSVLEVTPPMISESPKALSVEALVLDAVDKVSVDAPVTKQRLSVLVVDAGCNLKAIDDATEERKIDSFIAALVKKYGGQHKRIAPARFAIVMEMRDKLGNDPRLGLAFASRIISEFEHVSIGMHHDWVQLSGNTFVGGIAIDIAERIALNCPAQGFLLTEPIRAFSKGVSLRVSAVFQHKGMSAPIQMYECENLDDLKTLGIDSDETKRETNDLSLVDVGWPFIGRHRYQDIIKSLNETQEGGRVCWLVGSPGVGKSRVLVEIVKADPSRQWMFLNARNNGVIRAFIEQIGADIFGADVRGFVRWLGGGKLPKEYLNSTPEELISASSGVLARAVLTKSAMEPVGLIVDDYDLAPTQLRKILREVIELGRKNEITVILSSRNDASILEGERRVQLLPLKLNESHELISLLSGTADIPKNILQKTGGNPGIAVSLARLVRSGVEINKLQGSPDSNIARLLSDAWLENLGGPIREAILALGILGDEFSTSVGQTFVRDAFKNKVSWDELTHTGMLEFSPDGQSVRVSLFELGSLTEHYLESSNRCTYHRIAAGIFERLEDLPEVAAEHLTLAGDQERAIQVLRHGAHDLAQSGEGFRALECFRRLISEDFSPLKSQDSYIEDLLSCSRSCREVGDLRLAKDLSNRLDKVADEARGTRLGLGVSTERIQLWTIQGKTKEVRGGLLEVMKHAEREKDYGALACLMGVAADLNEKEGQLEKSVEFSKKAVSLAGRIGNAASQALAIGELGRIGRVLFKSNQHATAMGAFQNQIAIAEKTGNYKEIARARVNIGVVLQHTKKYTEALSAMEKGFSAAMRAGDFLTAAKASHNMGNVFVFQGQLKEAQSYFEKSLGLSEQMQWSQGVAINHAHLKKLASKAKDAGLGHSPLSK